MGRTSNSDVSQSDRRQVLLSRLLTGGFGLAGTLLATNVARIGSLLEIANKLVNAFSGPLFGIYVLAFQHLAPWTMPRDAAWVWVSGLLLYDFLY